MVEPQWIRRVAILLFLAVGGGVSALGQETYKARLSPVSMDTTMKVNIAGLGMTTATLTANKLTINGTFDGLLSSATSAHIRSGSATGVRGPELFELKVSAAGHGTVSGAFELTADQVESLRKGRFYVEIASEKAPDGNLWGWLLK